MNILLTNDDGYLSDGINLVFSKLQKYGNVIMFAPDSVRSAQSVSITLGKGIKYQKLDDNRYICNGTPADCVSFALSSLGIKFDLVVSGCNHGWNVSYDVIYSATIGAALQALTYKVPSIALSFEDNIKNVNDYLDDVMEYIFYYDLLSKEYLLNVNFPVGEQVNGIKISSLYYRDTKPYFEKRGDEYFALRDIKDDYSLEPDSDCYHLSTGYISICPLSKTYYSGESYKKIKKNISKRKS